jgi:hypothetical protein
LKSAPFKKSTWHFVDKMPDSVKDRYWIECNPFNWYIDDASELQEAVNRLLAVDRPKAALASVRHHTKKLDTPTLVRLLKVLATSSSEANTSIQFQSYDFVNAFETLDNRTDVSADELAHLEFMYLSVFEHEKRGVPHLERQLVNSPELFVQAVGLFYVRQNGEKVDPPEWHLENEEIRKDVAMRAYRLLRNARRIPGAGEDGKIDVLKLTAWIKSVRAQCKAYGREAGGDSSIGELLSKSKKDEDGIWPVVAIRDTLEELGNQTIARAMMIGLLNQAGVQWRGADGRQEREPAANYRNWSKQIVVDWPFTSRLLEEIAKYYDHDADRYDTNASLRKRFSN